MKRVLRVARDLFPFIGALIGILCILYGPSIRHFLQEVWSK